MSCDDGFKNFRAASAHFDWVHDDRLPLAKALVQLQARYDHRGDAASEACLSAATEVRRHVRDPRWFVPERVVEAVQWANRVRRSRTAIRDRRQA